MALPPDRLADSPSPTLESVVRIIGSPLLSVRAASGRRTPAETSHGGPGSLSLSGMPSAVAAAQRASILAAIIHGGSTVFSGSPSWEAAGSAVEAAALPGISEVADLVAALDAAAGTWVSVAGAPGGARSEGDGPCS